MHTPTRSPALSGINPRPHGQSRFTRRLAAHTVPATAPGFSRLDPETGELHTDQEPERLPDQFKKRLDARHRLYAVQRVAADQLPNTDTGKCMRCRRRGEQVHVLLSQDRKAHYGGLQTCKSLWPCPFCAFKISARRKTEIENATTLWTGTAGLHGQLYLLTLTIQHSREDRLDKLADALAIARRWFLSTRAVKTTFREMGDIGRIIALEVTHGENGWHPHNHMLILHRHHGPKLARWLDTLRDQWEIACLRAGLQKPSREHGLRLDDGSKAAAYLSKWGFAAELTQAHAKTRGGTKPFDFLQRLLDDQNDRQAARLFLDYAAAMKGRKALTWSAGLKARFQIDEKTDGEIADEQDQHSQLLATLTADHWRIIQAREDRALLLQIAETDGAEGIDRYLAELPTDDPQRPEITR